LAQQALRKHNMLVCKVLGIWRARLPRRVPGTTDRTARRPQT
jgi:hypothetical protein